MDAGLSFVDLFVHFFKLGDSLHRAKFLFSLLIEDLERIQLPRHYCLIVDHAVEIGGHSIHELLNYELQLGNFVVHVFNSSFEPILDLVTVLLLLRALDELR